MSNYFIVSHVVLWIFVIFQTLVIFFLTKLIVQFLNRFRLEKNKYVEKGKNAPLFREFDINGNIIRLSDFNNEYTLLVFIKDSCSICKKLLPVLPILKENGLKPLRIIVIAPEIIDSNNTPPIEFEESIVFVRSNDVVKNYDIEEVPTLMLVDPRGVINEIYQYNQLPELLKYMGISEDRELVS